MQWPHILQIRTHFTSETYTYVGNFNNSAPLSVKRKSVLEICGFGNYCQPL